jgi:isoquinoline 1-oxidoreductase alpha subunit
MELNVNGESYQVEAPTDMPLLWVLRDMLDIKGPKFGCGVGACGACTVLVDGIPVRACVTAAADVEGEITTIEGLPEGEGLHKVQEAWLKHQVPQCGYCQSGQILAAVALLSEIPQPTDADIDAAMTNLCRCGTYPRLRAAIHDAAGMEG